MKRVLGLIGTIVAGAVIGTVVSTVRTVDTILTFALLFTLAVGALGALAWWAREVMAENWANVNPHPTPPPVTPVYWPGSKADLAQKAAAKQQGREVG